MQIKVEQLKPDTYNPRVIDTYKYETLLTSIKEFPEMLSIRPIIVDTDYNILCGNMRYKACVELGYKSVECKVVDIPEYKKKELIIKDNVSYGEWDETLIDAEFNTDLFDKWLGYEKFDYSELNYADLDGVLSDMTSNVKRALKVEFPEDKFDEAKSVVKEARDNKIYVGGVFLNLLKKLSNEQVKVS